MVGPAFRLGQPVGAPVGDPAVYPGDVDGEIGVGPVRAGPHGRGGGGLTGVEEQPSLTLDQGEGGGEVGGHGGDRSALVLGRRSWGFDGVVAVVVAVVVAHQSPTEVVHHVVVV